MIVAVGMVMPLAAQHVDAAEARRVLQQFDCQTSLPGEANGEAVDRGAVGNRRGGRASVPWSSGLPGLGLAHVALWSGVLLAGAAVVVAVLRSRGAGAAMPAAPSPARITDTAVADQPTIPPAEHCDELAARGDFAAAVHGLLLRAFAALAERVGVLPPRATGRELLRLGTARSLAVDPLRHLVTASERVHFGGRPADRGLYDDLRQQLLQWEAACRRQP